MQQQVPSWLDVIRKGKLKMRRKALTCNNSAVCVAALGTMLKTYRPTALLRLESEKLPKAVARIRVYTAITLDSRVPVCFTQTSKGDISKRDENYSRLFGKIVKILKTKALYEK
ncbi:hypothetical protein V1478_000274 [Vespula squamosa]|uniref:Uncharacterized protein n=1 Tax=Vespula squamosa TaxID=30214 RepID=A0ABD2C728_VESSQ